MSCSSFQMLDLMYKHVDAHNSHNTDYLLDSFALLDVHLMFFYKSFWGDFTYKDYIILTLTHNTGNELTCVQ